MMVRIGMVQMNVKYHCLKENMIHAEEMIKQAKEMGAELCVLPECMDIGWGTPFEHPNMQVGIPGEVSDVLCEFAKKYRIWVASGLTERYGNAVYNSAILISEQGRIVSKLENKYCYRCGKNVRCRRLFIFSRYPFWKNCSVNLCG